MRNIDNTRAESPAQQAGGRRCADESACVLHPQLQLLKDNRAS